MQKLKTIDPTKKEFIANGKRYFIESTLSFERYRFYQKLQVQLGFGIDFYDELKDWRKIWDHANKSEFGNIAVIAHNKMNAIKGVDERNIEVLEMCALFINEENEDRKAFSQDLVDKKIADWEAEGLDIFGFFQLASSFIRGFTNAYNNISRNTSDQEKVQEKLN